VIELDSGGAIDLTVGEYVTSEGRSLAGKGVRPDVRAEDDLVTRGASEPTTDRDEALRRGLRVLGRELRQG
jgi:C-terminal processing protease CtpA/Prc